MHDPIVSIDFVTDELHQRREEGRNVSAAEAALASVDPADLVALGRVLDQLEDAPMLADWGYEEPSDFEGILDSLSGAATVGFDETLLPDKILGAWLGRIAGCNLGKPLEFGDHWTSEHIRRYLELADAYPLRDYVPVLTQCRPSSSCGRTGSRPRGVGSTGRRVTTTSTTPSWGCTSSNSTAQRSTPGTSRTRGSCSSLTSRSIPPSALHTRTSSRGCR